MCEQVNATHCQCLLDDMMCDNLMCLHRSKFCDGFDDCGDGSDEPENCETDCSLALEAYDETKICNNQIDCKGLNDFGNDESVDKCCAAENSLNNYRCVLGEEQNITVGECIPKKCVCDLDMNLDECSNCLNGADEVDCMSISSKTYFGLEQPKIPELDAFGRSKTKHSGYVYFNAHGQDYLYCASPWIFTEDKLLVIGDVLCKHENFEGVLENGIRLEEPTQRTKINPGLVLSKEEQEEYDNCKMVHLSCKH